MSALKRSQNLIKTIFQDDWNWNFTVKHFSSIVNDRHVRRERQARQVMCHTKTIMLRIGLNNMTTYF